MAIWFCNNDRVTSCCHGAGGAVFDSGPNGQRTFDRRKHEMCLIGLSGLASTACPRPVWICCGACLTLSDGNPCCSIGGSFLVGGSPRHAERRHTHPHSLSHTHDKTSAQSRRSDLPLPRRVAQLAWQRDRTPSTPYPLPGLSLSRSSRNGPAGLNQVYSMAWSHRY
jgi:hypothetical protein